ncbi:MAG: DUF4350 domain-containing protein [Holosporales bacterium]
MDLVVLHYYPSCGATCLSPESQARLEAFVRDGGRLLLTLTQNIPLDCHALLESFGLTYTPQALLRHDPMRPWILTETFALRASRDDLPFQEVMLDHTGSLSCAGDREFLLHDGGKGVVYLASHGKGQIAVVADTEMLSPTYIGAADNGRLALALFGALLDRPLSPQDFEALNDALMLPLEVPQVEDDSWHQEAIIDCRPYAHQLRQLANRVFLDAYHQREAFLFESSLLGHEFPRALRERLSRFKMYGHPAGFLLLRGLPVDEPLVSTPSDPCAFPQKNTFRSEFFLSAVGASLGEVFTFVQEKGGNFFHNLFPTPHNAHNISSESSDILLDFHTEIAFHPVNTDYLMLYCLRSDHEKKAKTILFHIHDLLPAMPRRYLSVLFEPLFRTGIDYSFGSPNGLKANGPVVPILTGDRHDPYFRCDFDLMEGITPLAQEALSYVKREALKVSKGIALEPGDLLVVDNNRVMHGRSSFKARYDGQDRWLQRVLVARDLVHYKRDIPIEDRTVRMKFAV